MKKSSPGVLSGGEKEIQNAKEDAERDGDGDDEVGNRGFKGREGPSVKE